MKRHWILLVVMGVCLAGPAGAQITLLHEFAGGDDDGRHPYGSLTLSGDTFYGMTYYGGDNNRGVVFRINTDGTGFELRHEFAGGADDGRHPYGSLTLSGGTLYGMTCYGGDHDGGVVFRMNTDGTGRTLLHEFAGGVDDGHYPYGSLTLNGGALYGMTSEGGNGAAGTIFRIDTDGAGYALLREFTGWVDDGSWPYDSLTLSGGTLYGMTGFGGGFGRGVIFRIHVDGTGFTLLHEFPGGANDGTDPYGSLTLSGNTLYGMTGHGGGDNRGAVFRMNTDGTGYTLLHEFAGGADDGRYPYGSLTLNGGRLYGMTGYGGDHDGGVIFGMNADGSGYTLLHEFAGGADDGRYPYGSLTLRGDTLYGVTGSGGDADSGVVFSLVIPEPPQIEALELFYNGKYSDAADPAKSFLAVGEASSMSLVGDDLHGNVTNCSQGITGIRVKFDAVVAFSGGVAAAFSYEATPEQSADKTFTTFTPPTSPTYVVENGTGKSVVTITFADGEIKNRWLKTIIDASQVSANGLALDGELSGPLTLPSGDGNAGGDAEFIIGHRVGDMDGNYRCLLNDAIAIRSRAGGALVGISNAYDVDKNERVLLNDAILTRNAVSGTALPALP